MTSPAAPLRRYTPTPPPPPPKERRPTIQTSPISIRSPNTKSPVRRKPLPSSAISPPLSALDPPDQSPQIFGQIVEHLRGRAQPDNRKPVTSSAGRDYFSAPVIANQLPPTKTESYQAQSPVVTRTYSDAESLSRSSSIHSLHRVEADRRPEPPTSGSQQEYLHNVHSPEPTVEVEEDMALKAGVRPPPLRTESTTSVRSQTAPDSKKPQTPGGKFTSFFARRPTGSPGSESSYSDQGKSPAPSPNPIPEQASASGGDYAFPRQPASQPSQDSIDFDPSAYMQSDSTMDRASQLEAELREISKELAGSIKREMDLEDMVERLQAEVPPMTADRTSDYFSDSGTSSIRPPTSEYNPKEEVERVKRDAEQQRASLKVDFSQRWQRELATRKAMESHLQYMEQKHSQGRQQINDSSDVSSRAKELESALDDARRRLTEERQTKENFEDLLSALRHDLEGHRNERDNLRDEVVPQLKSRIEGLEATLTEMQKSPYDHARMQHELQSLRDENAALHSARMMNAQFGSIAEEDEMTSSPQNSFLGRIGGGLQRSTTLGRSNSRAGVNRSNSLSRSNSVSKGAHIQNELPQNVAEQFKAIEQQRDALHTTVKYLLKRQTMQGKQYERRLKVAELERAKAERVDSFNALTGSRKGGYEREVRGLRSEVNLLRKRADDALEQKWQCEKGLAGLKMDLDRSKQETESLHRLLQATDNSDPEVLSSTLQTALSQLQQQSAQARSRDTLGSLANEQQLAGELEESTERSEALATQVKRQLKTNSGLRNRLKDAIEKGECDQTASAAQINQLQEKLRKLEDTITSTQTQSETAVMKHEEDIRVLRASHNSHLLRAKVPNNGLLSPTLRSPLSPMFSNSKRSPRLDKTSTGPGMPLHQALKTEYLEKKVEELEKALSDAEKEMGEVVSRMNTAQIGVADLEGERDEALRQTRRLEAAIGAEREKVRMLFGGLDLPQR